jgi:UDP-N-acetylglucosamine 4,6-dehydratase
MSLNDTSILVTGGTGSFAQHFIDAVLKLFTPKRVVVFSRDEYKQSEMQKRFSPRMFPEVRYMLGDVRDPYRMREALQGIDVVVHAAALKQVPAAEYDPSETIKTNVFGALNVIQAAEQAGVKKVIALSTDKAAMPVNLYGATKLCCQRPHGQIEYPVQCREVRQRHG